MDQSAVSPNSKKPFSFPIPKGDYKGKPVVPSPQLKYHNESMFSLFKDNNDKKDNTDPKPKEEHDGRNNCCSFQEYGNRKFQISIPEETVNTNSNWTHLKVFRENVESEYVLHQFPMLSARELKLVIEKIPEMIKEALLFEPTVGTAKLVIDLQATAVAISDFAGTVHRSSV